METTTIWILGVLGILTIIASILSLRANKRNDWVPIFIESCTYTLEQTYIANIIGTPVVSQIQKTCTCILQYSKIRCNHRIIHKGYTPREGYETSKAYNSCVVKQTELESVKNTRWQPKKA